MAQKARIDSGESQRQRFAIDANRTVLKRTDQILCSVHQSEQIASMLDVHPRQDGDQRFERRVAGAGPHAGQRSIHSGRAVLDGHDRVRHSQSQVVMRVHALAGLRIEDIAKRLEAVRDFVHQKSAGGVHHVDAVSAI